MMNRFFINRKGRRGTQSFFCLQAMYANNDIGFSLRSSASFAVKILVTD